MIRGYFNFSEFQVAEYQVTERHISEFNGIDIFPNGILTNIQNFELIL
jgi:hypothetical protein